MHTWTIEDSFKIVIFLVYLFSVRRKEIVKENNFSNNAHITVNKHDNAGI